MSNRLFSLGTISARWVLGKVLTDLLILLTTVLIIDKVAYIVGLVVLGTITRELLYSAVVIMVIILICRIVLSWGSSSITFRISAKVKLMIRNRIYSKLLNIELDYRDAKKTGALVTTTIEGVEALGIFYGRFFPQLFLSILIPAALYCYLSFYTQQIAMILILCVPIIPISIGLVQRWVRRVSKTHWHTYEDLNAYFLDSIQGITTLKLLGLTNRRTEKISQKSWDFRNKTMKLLYTNLTSLLVMDLIALLGTALGITLALLSFESGMIPLPVAILVLLISYEFFRPLRQLGSYFHFAMQGISASKSILEILNQSEEFENMSEGEKSVPGINHDIKFKEVWYSYGTNTSIILHGVSFIAKTGNVTAIVGQSGSGKTTIADLITMLYKPQSGQILIGNRDIQTMNREELRHQIAMVPQNPFLFYGSIRDNLLIAKPSATNNELNLVCKKAGILDFINSLPRGLDSSLTEQAKNFSKGQIQRIAIARALLKDSPILILDEPTSNIDAGNEVTILQTLKQIARMKTTILITHRLSTILDSDKIVVIDGGIIVDEGIHNELIARDGVYAELFHDQAMNDPLYRTMMIEK
ncbi:MAG: ABC transporter ATP-binding protein/permease [Candidatus Thorarchaeota archaeon]|nr:ABC transporter ATP-binding protein/permease [Candidatus Thorarchaeota archaeon]